jgi:hypothetical protein
MRFFALGILSSLTLVLSACGDDGKEPTSTATNTTPSGPTTDPGTGSNGTTTDDQTSGTTADNPTTDTPTSTTTMTTEPATSTTSPSTTDPGTGTSEPGTGTSEPGTSGTTGGGLEPGSDYGPCSNGMPAVMCDSMFCIDPVSTDMAVKGSFCSPACTGPGNLCSKPDGASAQLQAACLFDTDADMTGDICALVCPLESDICPTGMTCEDIGIPEQMGMKFGICTHPA